jgi:hypothetical protein
MTHPESVAFPGGVFTVEHAVVEGKFAGIRILLAVATEPTSPALWATLSADEAKSIENALHNAVGMLGWVAEEAKP